MQIIVSVGCAAKGSTRRGLGLRDNQDIGLVDRPPTDHGGAIEAQTLFKGLFGEFVGGDGEVLPDAREIHPAKVDGGDFSLANLGQDLFGSHRVGFLSGVAAPLSWRA